MTDSEYPDLYALIVALSGNDSFTTAEQAKILALANRRLYQAYRQSSLWPRYIVGAEALAAVDDVIDFTANVDTFLRVWDANPFTASTYLEYEFYVDVDGAHVQNNFGDLTTFYVSYYKVWDGPYLSSATTIPFEFFYYAAHATYADYLRMDGQVDKALAEEQVAQQYLLVELDKADYQRNSNMLRRRISTHASRQAR